MFQMLNQRLGHYVLLVTMAGGLFFPNLGAPSLWDIDEGNNAEAAREMLASGDWVVPTFNFQLRVDKPVLLYWLQMAAYHVFGVNELAARLPSALAALAAVLVTYELGRRLFGAATGLLAGLILASTALFCAAAHFANPDALLNLFSMLTLFCFWNSFNRQSSGWFVLGSLSAGLAVLAKGPVGLLLPVGVAWLFLVLVRQLRWLLDRRLLWGILAFVAVALPWYAWVGAETKAEFFHGFFLIHNIGRYRTAMEGHGGPFYYYAVVLLLGFAPWSPFFGLTVWHALNRPKMKDRGARTEKAEPAALDFPSSILDAPSSMHFLWCWITVYLVIFSFSATKLPNYILPIYAPVAILTARFLVCWQRGLIVPASWAVNISLAGIAVVGIGTALGLLVAAGTIETPFLRGRRLPGLEWGAALGILPVLGAVVAWRQARRLPRAGVIASLVTASTLFIGTLAAWGSVALDAFKAPRSLVRDLQRQRTEREIRVGAFQYFQPSLVFYCRREVYRLKDEEQVREFLRYPLEIYLFVPASVWESLRTKNVGNCRVLDRHRDLYQGRDIVLVTNR